MAMSLLERVGNTQQAQLVLHSDYALPDCFIPFHLLHQKHVPLSCQETRQGKHVRLSYQEPRQDAKPHVGMAHHGLIDTATCPSWVFDTRKLKDTVLITGPCPATEAFDTQTFSAFDDTVSDTSISPYSPYQRTTFSAFTVSADDTVSDTSISSNNVCLYDSACPSRLCEFEDPDSALQTLCLLDKQGYLIANDILFRVLQKCADELNLCRGRQVFSLVVSSGLDLIASFGDHLVDLFASSGSLQEALAIFHKIAQPSARSWHALISGCVVLGETNLAFELFDEMQQHGTRPNDFIFTSILKACGSTGALGYGRIIHIQIIRQGLASNVFIGSTLIDMYAKCECLDEARHVFDELAVRNAVTWNAMIGGYVKHGHGRPALQLFDEMQLEGIKPNRVTFLCVLKACSILGVREQGMHVHSHAIGGGLELNVQVGTALIDMYAKCGNLKEAINNFQKLRRQDGVAWGAIIAGYVQHGDYLFGLEMFDHMQDEGIEPDIATWSSAIKACGGLGALQRGKHLHEQVTRSGQVDVVVVSILVEMYAKCGNLDEARRVLDDWPDSGVAAWGAMIAGYAAHGSHSLASRNFKDMQKQGVMPNEVIYTSMLEACSRAGQVKAGCEYFKGMEEKHGVLPGIEHFGCMVDLFGRGGYFGEAVDLLELMPFAPDLKSWMSLLTGCEKCRNVKLGRHCFDQIVRLNPAATVAYALMTQIYTHAHMWDNVKEIQELRRFSNAWKKPGKAWLEVNMEVHEFVVDEQNHPMLDEIYNLLESLRKPMEEEGYTPEAELEYDAVSMSEKEVALFGHCEKLAIAFGLLSLPQGETIRVTKNLRMCNDCHTVGRILSKVEQRNIIVRDEYCVHHFKDGLCSCGDNL